MDSNKLKALVSLLDEENEDNLLLIEQEIQSLGEKIIPFLEKEWELNTNPEIQNKIEDLIHSAQFTTLKKRFKLWKSKSNPDVLEGMFLCVKYNYPNFKIEDLKGQIKLISVNAAKNHNDSLIPYEQVRNLNNYLFNTLKFKPNRKNFHNPSNSFLNIVLESNLGNPLSLSVIYMLVAQQLGMPVYGVNFPNLFVLTYKGLDTQFYINAYNNGLIFTKKDVEDYLKQLKLSNDKKFYEPCSSIDIIARNIRNLISAYSNENNPERVEELKELLKILES